MNIDTLHYVPSLFQKIVSNIWIKIIGIFSYIIVYPFFDPNNKTALTALFFLILADMVTGMIAAYKCKIKIESAKVFRTALKMTIYYVMISAGNLTELAGVVFLPLNETLIALLAVTELISILENSIAMGYVAPARLLNRLKKFRDK